MSHAADTYKQALSDVQSSIKQDEQRDRRFLPARVLTFLGAIVFWAISVSSEGTSSGSFWLGCLSIAAFLVIVIVNEPIRRRLEDSKQRRDMLRRLKLRCDRDWKRIARLAPIADPQAHIDEQSKSVAADLDLFGHASLFRLVSTAGSAQGVHAIADWITRPVTASLATQRAQWSSSLVEHRDQRIEFYETARIVGAAEPTPADFIEWAESPAWLEKRKYWLLWAKISIAVFVLALLGGIFLYLESTPTSDVGNETQVSAEAASPTYFWLQCFVVGGLIGIPVLNLFLSMVALAPMHQIFAIAMRNREMVERYRQWFDASRWMTDPKQVDNELVSEIRNTLIEADHSASEGMAGLARIARAGSLRSQAATYLVYLVLQLIGLYDLWVLRRLETWQSEFRDHVRSWFQAAGTLEAVAAMAAVRDEHPEWTTAQWVDANSPEAAIRTQRLGHPLLAETERVCNDVTIGPRQSLLLVTGSNMSGKSTMLRSVGLNVALANAGGPVCAKEMTLPPVEMATSIRVRDDLSAGVSFYMAELKRLKEVVDHAESLAAKDDRLCLFLLDEILQGTNSREREIAVSRVLQKLVGFGAIGAITTHDLELASDPELVSLCETVHFRETIQKDEDGKQQMTFDYQMHPGVCPTTNALRLLEMVGI